ncbi:hypothetical protein H0H81_000123 [Sphagnurus paluster]|uniref:Uncharacterized protein n=1 Tax=Sphagnurus paluster TaxID=117069 RepID=A0A9P7KI62_9AGAR|nr:hypothetical protein H0H81_000123 [Sphagnurus paluster]
MGGVRHDVTRLLIVLLMSKKRQGDSQEGVEAVNTSFKRLCLDATLQASTPAASPPAELSQREKRPAARGIGGTRSISFLTIADSDYPQGSKFDTPQRREIIAYHQRAKEEIKALSMKPETSRSFPGARAPLQSMAELAFASICRYRIEKMFDFTYLREFEYRQPPGRSAIDCILADGRVPLSRNALNLVLYNSLDNTPPSERNDEVCFSKDYIRQVINATKPGFRPAYIEMYEWLYKEKY